MRHHRETPKKPSKNNILTKSKIMLNITKLDEIIDLISNLKFESFEIIAIKQLLRKNKKSTFVAKDSKKIEKNKCELPHVLNYKKNRRFLFIINLHCDTNEQSNQITFYFKFK